MGLWNFLRDWSGMQATSSTPSHASAAPPQSPPGMEVSSSGGNTPALLQGLPATKPLVEEGACSEDEENSSDAYQTLLSDAREAVETGAVDALQWVRAALAHTAPLTITAHDGTEVSVQPTHGGFYLSWVRAVNPMDSPKAKPKAPKSRRGAHFRTTEKKRSVRLTMTHELADKVSTGLLSALLAHGARSAARSEAALSLTALALQPVFAQFLRQLLLAASSSPVALHTDHTSTITEVLRDRMRDSFADFAGSRPIHG